MPRAEPHHHQAVPLPRRNVTVLLCVQREELTPRTTMLY